MLAVPTVRLTSPRTWFALFTIVLICSLQVRSFDIVDLTWSEHISTIVNKANQVLGLIRRTVGTANTTTFSLLYKTLVRPLLEYAAPVWNPYLVKDIHAIESVQRCASRFKPLGKKEVICLMKSVVTCYIGHLCPVVGHISLLSNVIRSYLAYRT